MMNSNTKPEDVVINIGDVCYTGKNAVVTLMSVIEPPNDFDPIMFGRKGLKLQKPKEPITLKLELEFYDWEILYGLLNDDKVEQKIRNKKVDDCSIKELLFAVRNKIK